MNADEKDAQKIAACSLSIKVLEARQALRIELLGESLSAKNGWGIDSGEAIALYLAKKYGWTLEHCSSLSHGNLLIALCEELEDFQTPKNLMSVFEALELTLEKLKEISER